MPKLKLGGDASAAIQAMEDLAVAEKKAAAEGDNTATNINKVEAAAKRLAAQADPTERYRQKVEQLNNAAKAGVITQEKAVQIAGQLRAKLDASNPALKEAAAGEDRLRTAAERLRRELETPQDKYQRELKETGKLLRSGAINQAEFVAKAKQLKSELNASDPAFQKLNENQRKLQQTAGRIKESLVTPYENYRRQVREVIQAERADLITKDQKREAVARLRTELRSAGQAQRESFGDRAVKQVGALAASYLSVQGALSLVTAELQKQKELREEQTQAQLSVADSEQKLRQNSIGLAAGEREKFIGDVASLASETSLPQREINLAAASTLSATGSAERTLEILKTASAFTRDPAQIESIAGGIADLIATGAAATADESLGVLTTTAAGSRVTDVSKVATELGKVSASFTSELAGSDAATGGALFAALTKATADTEGRTSRTGAIALKENLDKFFADDSIAKRFAPGDIDTFNEQLALTRGTDLGREFIGSDEFNFEKTVKGGIEKFLLGDEESNAAFEDVRSTLRNREALVAAAKRDSDFVNQGSLSASSQTSLAIQSGGEQFRLGANQVLSQEEVLTLNFLISRARGTSLTEQQVRTNLAAGLDGVDRGEAIGLIESGLDAAGGRTRFGDIHTRGSLDNAVDKLTGIRDKLIDIEANQRGARVSPRGQAE